MFKQSVKFAEVEWITQFKSNHIYCAAYSVTLRKIPNKDLVDSVCQVVSNLNC